MTRVLRSAVKNNRTKENLSSKLSVCNNSKTIKKNSKKKVIANIEESRQDDIWNINSIRYNIFEYMDFEDFLEFNTVCKRWNNITNPIIHKTIKLHRCEKIKKLIHDKRLVKSAKTDAEVEMCIINNSKHAQYIKELNLSENLEPQRAIQLFEKFKFLTKLTISGATMSQDQFISMMIPLTQLQELNLSSVGIKKMVKKKFISEPSLLPQSLTKLALVHTKLYNNPELFIQTINSHTNLIEYKYISYDGANFLDPFFKNYPSLKIFEYGHQKTDYSQSLIKVFKSNAQLKTLKLPFSLCNDALMSSISCHLTNLEEFSYAEYYGYDELRTSIISKFTNPTKIKKLNLSWDKLNQCSINSILLNCPYLEELYLKHAPIYLNTASDISIDSSKLSNIKKLKLRYNHLSKISYNSIITKCPRIKELDIELPREWKECMKVIGSTCTDLESLMIKPYNSLCGQESNIFYQEFYQVGFLASNPLYKSSITHLTLKRFNFYASKAEYFNSFKKLKYIKYPRQYTSDRFTSKQDTNFNKDLWSNYKFVRKNNKYNFDAKMIKILP